MAAEAPSSKPMSIILALVIGAVGGSLDQSIFGFCSGAVLGFLLAQVFSLRERVRLLDRQFQLLKAARDHRVLAPQLEPEQPLAAVYADQIAVPAVIESSIPAPNGETIENRLSREGPEAPAFAHSEPTPMDRVIEKALAWIKGGNPLARIGIVIL